MQHVVFGPEGDGADVLEFVRGMLQPEWRASAELLASRNGWRLDDHGPAAHIAAKLGAALGTEASFDAPYWMEAPLWQAVAPTLICGPSGGGLHSVEEWVDLEQLQAFTHALIDTFGRGASR